MEKASLLSHLAHRRVNWESYKPEDNEQDYYFNLVKDSPSIRGDYEFLGDKISIRQYSEYCFATNGSIVFAFADFEKRTTQDGTPLYDLTDKALVYKNFRKFYAEAFFFIHYRVREGLPIYIMNKQKFEETDNSPDYLDFLSACVSKCFEDYVDIPIDPMCSWLNNLYFSKSDMKYQDIFFSQYESQSSIELEIRKQAFTLCRKGQLFSNKQKLEVDNIDSFSTKERESLLKTIGALSIALGLIGGNKFRKGDTLSVNAIAQFVLESVKTEPGLSDRSIRSKIGEGLSMVTKS